MSLFNKHSVDLQADSLAAYLPSGELFKSARISDSNFRKLLLGLASELFNAEGYLVTAANEYDVRTTTLFIEEWESALGIPDDCFDTTGSIIQRRGQVLLKLYARGTQTVEDFIEIGNLLGITLTVTPGIQAIAFPLTFPVYFFFTNIEARFSIFILSSTSGSAFPLLLPFLLGPSSVSTLNCFLQKIKPANVNLIFEGTP